jgi:hypothetical protein
MDILKFRCRHLSGHGKYARGRDNVAAQPKFRFDRQRCISFIFGPDARTVRGQDPVALT